MKRRKPWLASMLFILLLPQTYGQGGGQAISGTVIDTSHAVVADARVVVKNVATGIKIILETNSEGFYSTPPDLKPGAEYQIEASKAGFETLVRRGVILHLAERLRIDVTLKLGAVTQSVEVN